jgi:hypothetical protein
MVEGYRDMNDICMTVTMTFTEEDINCFLHYGGTDVKSLKPGALEKLAAIIGNRTKEHMMDEPGYVFDDFIA